MTPPRLPQGPREALPRRRHLPRILLLGLLVWSVLASWGCQNNTSEEATSSSENHPSPSSSSPEKESPHASDPLPADVTPSQPSPPSTSSNILPDASSSAPPEELTGPSRGPITGPIVDPLVDPEPPRPKLPEITIDSDFELPNIAKLPFAGSPTPLITLIAFIDFECPFSRKLNPSIEALIAAQGADVRVVFAQSPQPYHKHALLSARASLAAHAQGRFREYQALLFSHQNKLKREDLEKYAQSLSLDLPKFISDLDSKELLSVVESQAKMATQYGLPSTPGLLINGVALRGPSISQEHLSKIIEGERARAKKLKADFGLEGETLRRYLFHTSFRPPPPPGPPEAEQRRYFTLEGSPSIGPEDALVTIVEFSDFHCRPCTAAHQRVLRLMKQHPDQLRLVYKHYVLPRAKSSVLTHRATLAAEAQGQFWPYHEYLISRPNLRTPEQLLAIAKRLKMDLPSFEAALKDTSLDSKVLEDLDEAKGAAVRGAPQFFLNGVRLSGAQPYASFRATVQRELATANHLIEEGVLPEHLYQQIVRDRFPIVPQPLTLPPIDLSGAPIIGPASAPVTIIVFGDFQSKFHARVVPTLKLLLEAYPHQLRLAFKHLPLRRHPRAYLAAQASLAAHEQGKFWEYHDLLFKHRTALERPQLDIYAEELHLDMTRFKAALDSKKFAAQVDEDTAFARKAGISGTPSFFINGERFVGEQPIDNFKKVINSHLPTAALKEDNPVVEERLTP